MRAGHGMSSASASEVRPRSGNQLTTLPPAKTTTRRIAKRKPGMAYPTMTAALVHTSKVEPSRTALATPSGMEMAYTSSVVQRPSEIDTGILSITRLTTGDPDRSCCRSRARGSCASS